MPACISRSRDREKKEAATGFLLADTVNRKNEQGYNLIDPCSFLPNRYRLAFMSVCTPYTEGTLTAVRAIRGR